MKLVKSTIRLGGAFLTGGSSIAAELAISSALDKISPSNDVIVKEDFMGAIKAELTDKELREDINSFRDDFDKLLKETKSID